MILCIFLKRIDAAFYKMAAPQFPESAPFPMQIESGYNPGASYTTPESGETTYHTCPLLTSSYQIQMGMRGTNPLGALSAAMYNQSQLTGRGAIGSYMKRMRGGTKYGNPFLSNQSAYYSVMPLGMPQQQQKRTQGAVAETARGLGIQNPNPKSTAMTERQKRLDSILARSSSIAPNQPPKSLPSAITIRSGSGPGYGGDRMGYGCHGAIGSTNVSGLGKRLAQDMSVTYGTYAPPSGAPLVPPRHDIQRITQLEQTPAEKRQRGDSGKVQPRANGRFVKS